MNRGERQVLRDAALAAVNGTCSRAHVRGVVGLDWQLQDSNSFRRIGTLYGDGDVLCGTKHPIDGHPDLLAAPGVLDYVIASQPHAVLALLDYIDAIEGKLDRLDEIERQLGKMRAAVEQAMKDVFR